MPSPVDPVACSGFSRRSFFRFAAGASALATMPILTESRLAMAARPHFADPNRGIHIDANENPMGPSDAARQAIIDIVPRGGRYLFPLETEPAEIFAKQEGLNPDSVMPFAGSSRAAALHRAGFHQQGPAAGDRRSRLRSADVGRADAAARPSSRCRCAIPRARPRTTSRPCWPRRRIPA